MYFGESCDDIIKNWIILFGLLLHLMDYIMIPYAQSTNTTQQNCFIVEEKWRELMPKRGTLIETNLIKNYNKNFEKIKDKREITSLYFSGI
ncbi:hypothetical protein Mgra_00006435 [Meloidogyne graminicola]|uniref:Uncharacterized protein n=1 Tax=Meloidogyne graminicola TaxID=189291 RepID=A0A8S9ZKZ7_9BILA|nr:hypothetical protein Mgra_00006435 [Meloidogyne graminicola]